MASLTRRVIASFAINKYSPEVAIAARNGRSVVAVAVWAAWGVGGVGRPGRMGGLGRPGAAWVGLGRPGAWPHGRMGRMGGVAVAVGGRGGRHT